MKGYILAEVYLDVDNKESTGKALGMDSSRKGFDLGIEINSGLKFNAGGAEISQYGSIESIPEHHEVTDVLTTYDVNSRSSVGRKIKSGYTSGGSNEARTTIQRHKLIVKVPYDQVGLKSGDTVRMCFVDHTMKFFKDDKVSADADLTLD